MAVFNSDESKNWLKQWMAVFITREGILPSVKAVSESMHTDILTKASNLQIATCTQDHGRITDNSPLHCPFHRLIRDEIKAIHKRIPSWRNSPTDTWYDTPFAISKLFMQASGYDDKTNFQDTDFNGIAAFVCNSGKFTQNVEIISNEARKAVNKIRHTPNMLSNELTNQATHDCIAKLSALLNEQVFRGVPQVLRARKQLDELKTNFPDLNKELCKYIIDEVVSKGIQDISDLVTAEETQCRQDFDKRRADMETISNLFMSSITTQSECAIYDIRQTLDNSLKNLTMYIGNAKTVLKTTTEQAKRDVKEASEVGRHKLEMTTKELKRDLVRISDCTNLKLEEAASANKHTLEETTLVAQVQLEDTTMDGRKELVETTVAGKRELIETVICGQRRLQQMLEEGLDGFIQTLKPQDEYDQAKAMSELRKHLSKHYERTAGQMKIRMEIDAALEDIYEEPKLVFKNKTDQSENVVDVEFSDINQMFMCGEGSLVKTIFVEGEAGSGKTSLCKNIVRHWSKHILNGSENVEQQNLICQFEFVFYIVLREVEGHCNVKEIILRCLLEQIDSDYQNANDLLSTILKSERCLLILDGLDEWEHARKCKRDERIPHIESSWQNCTTLFTTRAYKMTELKISRSQVGNHVHLQGVNLAENLVSRIVLSLSKYNGTNKRPQHCIRELKDKKLWHFSATPILLIHLVWLWHKDKLEGSQTLSGLYKEIIEERWFEFCDKKQQTDRNSLDDLLETLSGISFKQLLSIKEENSIAFKMDLDERQKFNEKQLNNALESGILSSNTIPGERSCFQTYQFLHKTFQEYLSAIYLSRTSSQLSENCLHIHQIYEFHRTESVLGLSQVFIFLCGLNPTAASELSVTMNNLFTVFCERNTYSVLEAQEFQDMILRGHEEAEKVGHFWTHLCLRHIVLGEVEDEGYEANLSDKQRTILKMYLLGQNQSEVTSLYVGNWSELLSNFLCPEDKTALNLEAFERLKHIVFNNIPYTDIKKLHLHGVLECSITFSKYQLAQHLVSILQTTDLQCLKTLQLSNFSWECSYDEVLSTAHSVQMLALTWDETNVVSMGNKCLKLQPLENADQLKTLTLSAVPYLDVHNLPISSLHNLNVSFRNQHRANHLMSSLLLQQGNTLVENRSRADPFLHLRRVYLQNVIMSDGMFRCLLDRIIETRHSVECILPLCTIESEEDVDQPQAELKNQPIVQPHAFDYTTRLILRLATMSADSFEHFVRIVNHTVHSVDCLLIWCTIESGLNPTEPLQDKMVNQFATRKMTRQSEVLEYTVRIKLIRTTLPAGVLMCLVKIALNSGNLVRCCLESCRINPEEDVWQVQKEMEKQPALKTVEFRRNWDDKWFIRFNN